MAFATEVRRKKWRNRL